MSGSSYGSPFEGAAESMRLPVRFASGSCKGSPADHGQRRVVFGTPAVHGENCIRKVLQHQLRDGIAVPVEAGRDAIVGTDRQARAAVMGLQTIRSAAQIEIATTDHHVIIERTRRKGVVVELVGPAQVLPGLPVGDAFAEVNILLPPGQAQAADGTFDGATLYGARYTDA